MIQETGRKALKWNVAWQILDRLTKDLLKSLKTKYLLALKNSDSYNLCCVTVQLAWMLKF